MMLSRLRGSLSQRIGQLIVVEPDPIAAVVSSLQCGLRHRTGRIERASAQTRNTISRREAPIR